jgi:uncharacterized protein (TIGR03067 family)
MKCWAFLSVVALSASCSSQNASRFVDAGPNAEKDIRRVWIAKEIETDGKRHNREHVDLVTWTFGPSSLVKTGERYDEQEDYCDYALNTNVLPNRLTLTAPSSKPIPGIFELNGSRLRVCLRRFGSDKGYPDTFSTEPGCDCTLVEFIARD